MSSSSDSARGNLGKSPAIVTRGFSISMVDIAVAATSARSQLKKHQTFALGGSPGDYSLSEQVHSMEQKSLPFPHRKKAAILSFGGSSNEDESSPPQQKRQKYLEEVAKRTIKEEPPSDEDLRESDAVDESAIDDDDDSSDWEDSVEESGSASIDEKNLFQRVDSRPHLTSRRSLITTMLHENDRANTLATAAIASRSSPAFQRSRTTSPNGPSLAASPDSDDAPILMMKSHLKPIAELPQAGLRPIIKTTTNTTPHQLALSPRTTRRNMLATELTVSLRQHLLWERQQKSQTANAVLKRRHTANDVANLKQFPEKVYMKQEDQDAQNPSWNEYFSHGIIW